MRLNDLIQRFNLPSLQIPVTASISSKLTQMRESLVSPLSRASKMLANGPAILEGFKFPKIPTLSVPSLTDPFNTIKAGFLGLKNKIPEIGFPKFPPMPDIGGFIMSKINDIQNQFTCIIEGAIGVAEDWKAAQVRKKIIRYVIIFIVLGIAVLFTLKGRSK